MINQKIFLSNCYSIIFSYEDSRIGVGLADLMFNYGRTTDIEWVYQVTIDNNNSINSEVFQGASHITENFNGDKYFNHPILINATLNCNFIDSGLSDYKFFLSPIFTSDPNFTRQILKDENPWTYRIMGEELGNEGRYEENSNPQTVEISDVRNYIYIEYNGNAVGNNAINIPPSVPTPFPPLNPANIVYICPKTAANPQKI